MKGQAAREESVKNYSPDLYQLKIPKFQLPKDWQYVVQLMAPFNMWYKTSHLQDSLHTELPSRQAARGGREVVAEVREDDILENRTKHNPMKVLENRTKDSKLEMEVLENLQELNQR
ncbi:UNVERIFIED_CONTAM: hypothetical protein K2H54_069724 [Gekko kuhli]